MAYQSPSSNMLPFRDVENKGVAYGASPNAPTSDIGSDAELLVPPQGLDEDAMQHFTATGRPAPRFKSSGLMSLGGGGDTYTLPQLLPKRYTDDSIIPAIVTNVVRSEETVQLDTKKRKSGFLSRFKGKKEKDEVDENGEKKGIMKVVYMPRRDYLKHFAKDERGVYIGSEPYRKWTEEELEEEFAKYKPKVGKK
ncbi:hypothetical protein N431DRAFT_543685 [Stipitochalara longipes BDJ]|nr:hypothetical protein N431DRAFT_543685 [Stipitochalara longipes BDJ]